MVSSHFAIISASELILALSSCSVWFVAYVTFSLSLSSAVQYALNFTSSSCCFLSSATMSSMAFFTFVNASSWTCTATTASCSCGLSSPARKAAVRSEKSGACRACKLLAARISNAAACCLARFAAVREEASCNSEAAPPVPIFLWKSSRASSSVRIAMASLTAWSSSPRAFVRCFQSWSRSWHLSFKFLKNSTSAPRDSRVASRSSFASESAFTLAPNSSSISSSMAILLSICFSNAALS
mmetsp:Transcript_1258/g.2312  ORF Transcript_1258/g.2312 Transcript_1258/m.2312 type:complete len:241 (+) Transcript_1258:878-1600(+)